ncbi:hypothetical protein SBA7_450001 [Candidatus Sulfotelmatobacter sp. SbA7]|nr:hypothetical protein SBA7_450001 [Candidatus Sulfotelmatobacter sp. SbA7]
MLYQLSYIGSTSLPLPECIKSLRRTHVFNANITKIASVASRIRGSLMVVHANTPNATNAASPAYKRFTSFLVHREGFEPSYLARRDRFTVCWL